MSASSGNSDSSQIKAALDKIAKIDKAFSSGVKALDVIYLDQYRKMKTRRNEMVEIIRSKGYK